MLGLCAPTDPIPPATHAPGYSDPFCRQWMPMGPGCSLVKVAGRHGPTVCAVQLSKAATDADLATVREELERPAKSPRVAPPTPPSAM